MNLSDQAVGAVMMALQKSLMEQSDSGPVLEGFKMTNSPEGLVVLNPPLVKFNDEFEENQLIEFEIEYLGFRLSEDVEVNNMLKKMTDEMGITHISDLNEESETVNHHWTIIRSIEKLKTKNGKPYANVRVDDGSSFRVWWNKLQYIDSYLVPGKLVVVQLNSDTFGRSLAHGRSSFMNDKEVQEILSNS